MEFEHLRTRGDAVSRRVSLALGRQSRARAGAHARRFLATVARSIQNENGNGVPAGSNPESAEVMAEAAAAAGAKKAGANGAAGKAAKKAPFGKWLKDFDKTTRGLASSIGSSVSKKAAELKGPAMEMKVNVDVLQPTIDSVKKGVGSFWTSVPPPVRKASPYLGVAAVTAIAVHSIESKLRKASEKKLLLQLAQVEEEKAEVAGRYAEWKSESKNASTIEMSKAVAEATSAAAAAAAAAAEAAKYCVVRR